MKKSIICHLFYPEVSLELLRKLHQVTDSQTEFFINIQGSSAEHYNLYNYVKANFKNAFVLMTPNKGRDIGAKLLLIDLILSLKRSSDYTLIIHDKKSPHLEGGDFWREELFKIISPKFINKVFTAFETDSRIGLIGAAQYIQNEYNEQTNTFACNSNAKIKEVLKKFSIRTNDYDFIAGNIFWIRTRLLEDFFAERSILNIRAELEAGNALDFDQGTFIHSWERIMSWIATSQGYKIYGI